ncbi:MAG: hypothetical protein WKG01_24560 [Kofleriaceae bacterium]
MLEQTLGRVDWFGASMTFSGVYRYASTEDLNAAIAEVTALLDGEDDDELIDGFDAALRRRDLELKVDLAADGPRNWYEAYETLVEVLSTRAVEGVVESSVGDVVRRYPPRSCS